METLLLVDDDKDIVELLSEILESEYKIVVAFDGREAWEQYKKHTPDIVITDVRMPDMDGIELIKLIRAENDTVILAISGVDLLSLRLALDSGANFCLEKPFTANQVRRLILGG